jgi:hypothetical protein
MLENEMCIFVHPDLVVFRLKVAHDNVVAATRSLIVAASTGIDSMGPVFLLGAERYDLHDGGGYAPENARLLEKVAGAFEGSQGFGSGLLVVGRIEPKMRGREADPLGLRICR